MQPCEESVALGKLGPEDGKYRTFYVAPLVPIICPLVVADTRSTDDLFGFEAEENIELFPAQTKRMKPKP